MGLFENIETEISGFKKKLENSVVTTCFIHQLSREFQKKGKIFIKFISKQ